MICDIGDNSPRRLEDPTEVQCRWCGQKYFVRLFPLHSECSMSELRGFLEEQQSIVIGLGDVVEKAIDIVTFGMVNKTDGCGCEKRKEWLNKLLSWKSRQ